MGTHACKSLELDTVGLVDQVMKYFGCKLTDLF